MSWGFVRRLRFGPFTLNLSKRGASVTAKAGRLSTNSRTRQLRVNGPFGGWWQSRRKR